MKWVWCLELLGRGRWVCLASLTCDCGEAPAHLTWPLQDQNLEDRCNLQSFHSEAASSLELGTLQRQQGDRSRMMEPCDPRKTLTGRLFLLLLNSFRQHDVGMAAGFSHGGQRREGGSRGGLVSRKPVSFCNLILQTTSLHFAVFL